MAELLAGRRHAARNEHQLLIAWCWPLRPCGRGRFRREGTVDRVGRGLAPKIARREMRVISFLTACRKGAQGTSKHRLTTSSSMQRDKEGSILGQKQQLQRAILCGYKAPV